MHKDKYPAIGLGRICYWKRSLTRMWAVKPPLNAQAYHMAPNGYNADKLFEGPWLVAENA